MKKRLEKGTYGYMDRLKMWEWKKSALMLAIPVLVFLIGWAVMKTRLQVVTVIAVVGCLPGCNEVVHAIMASRYHSMDKKLYEEVEAARGDRMALYENVFTTYDKNLCSGLYYYFRQRGAWIQQRREDRCKMRRKLI